MVTESVQKKNFYCYNNMRKAIGMPYVKNTSYCYMPFSTETPHTDFYTYTNVKQLAAKCKIYNDEIVKCRTIGILQSLHGRFFLTDIDSPSNYLEPLVQVSMVYIKSPPHSTIIPYPVQVFGTLQWKNRPVIFAKILQAMIPSMAIRVRDTVEGVTSIHLAKNNHEHKDET